MQRFLNAPGISLCVRSGNTQAYRIKRRHSGKMVQENASPRIFIADDSLLIRQRVACMLGASAMTVVGQARTPQDSISGILAAYPDVVVLDVQLEGGSGLQV